MSDIGLAGIFVLIAVIALIGLSVPPKKEPAKKEITCPRCGAKNGRLCPNCTKELPEKSVHCSKCNLPAVSVPCKFCGADLSGLIGC